MATTDNSQRVDETYMVYCRYEYRTYTGEGKDFTKWFPVRLKRYDTESDAKDYIKYLKDSYAYVDRITKLKHEYKVVPYSEYVAEQNANKERAAEIAKKYNEYKNSDEYKELKRKKRVARKEQKRREAGHKAG